MAPSPEPGQCWTPLSSASAIPTTSGATGSTQIETDHELFDQLLRRALQDLRLLIDKVDGNLVPSAGIPWFAVPFGRDSLITSMQTLSLRPTIAAGTLRFLAQPPGHARSTTCATSSPGKILHEVRLGELAKLKRVPHSPYYGSVDATPLFLVALGEYVRWTGDLDLARELLPNAEAALAWMRRVRRHRRRRLRRVPEPLQRGHPQPGLERLARLASHRDGQLAEPPIALAEVQGYVYAAHREMADLYARLGDRRSGDARRERTRRTLAAERFLDRLACPTRRRLLGDGPRRATSARSRRVTSNPGHALWAGLLARRARARPANACSPTTCSAAGAFGRFEPIAGLQPDELPQRLGLAARQR